MKAVWMRGHCREKNKTKKKPKKREEGKTKKKMFENEKNQLKILISFPFR